MRRLIGLSKPRASRKVDRMKRMPNKESMAVTRSVISRAFSCRELNCIPMIVVDETRCGLRKSSELMTSREKIEHPLIRELLHALRAYIRTRSTTRRWGEMRDRSVRCG